jgi:hypothetical protein
LKPETLLQAQIVAALKKLGVWVIRTQVSGRRGARSVATGEPGMPDLYLPGLGHLEVKHGDKSMLSDEQTAWHIKAALCGVNVGVARSVGDACRLVELWRKQKGRAA